MSSPRTPSAREWWALLERRSAKGLILAVIYPLVGFVLVYAVFVWTLPGQWLDAKVFGWVQHLAPGELAQALPVLGRVLILPGLTVVACAVAVAGIWRGAWRELGAALFAVAASVSAAPWLRTRVLRRPDYGWYGYSHNTLPSTHVAAAAAVTFAVVVLWPCPRPRWLMRVAAVAIGLACAGNVIGYSHLPSDVLASLLLVAFAAACSVWIFRPALSR